MPETIPARIIQTARHRALKLRQQAIVANLRLLNPEFQYCFFDDEDVERFIDQEYPQYRSLFDAFEFRIQRYDFFRYLAVYRLGGFYFDLDVLLATGVGGLRPAGCVFPFEGLTFSRLLRARGMDWEVGNYAFGAAAGHPFLKAVIENCIKAQIDPRWADEMMRGVPPLSRREHTVLYTTGPGLVSRTLVENPDLAASVTVLFPDDVCDPSAWSLFGQYGVHLMEGTWRPPGSWLRRRIAQRWETRSMDRLLRRSRRLGSQRSLSGTSWPTGPA